MRTKHILVMIVVLSALAVLVFPVGADHQITFNNNCNQDVYMNLQGGPQGVCDGQTNPDGSQKTCIACQQCVAGPPAVYCNTTAVTGNTTPICCPGVMTAAYCNTGQSCTPAGCCPGIATTAGQSYNCPSNETSYSSICANTSMTATQINDLSGYYNTSLNIHPVACNGSLIAGGGFKLTASSGTATYTFPDGWSGAFFPRSGCTLDANGYLNCNTGNCVDALNRSLFQCGGAASTSPVTKIEITFGNTWTTVDYYDVSYVNGFNLGGVFTPIQYNSSYYGPAGQCVVAGCPVGLSSFKSPKVPSWNMLKYTSVGNFIGIWDDGDYFQNTHVMTGDPATGPNAANWTLFYGYSCPVSEGYVNDSTISCNGVPAGKTCKTCAGPNTNLYPFNQQNALPNTANLFFDTCPTAYAYQYNDSAALMTCMGTNAGTPSNYKINITCDSGTPAPTVTGISPASAENTTSVAITNLAGTGFTGTPTVSLTRTGYSDITATGVSVVSSEKITCTFNLANQIAGLWNVKVVNPDTQQGLLANGFAITNASIPAPTIASISPGSGENSGTVSITNLAGTGFYGAPTVKLSRTGYNDITATGVTVVNSEKITCTFNLNGKTPGSWNVNVINPDGQTATLSKGFTITNPVTPAPTVTGISPGTGQNTTSVSITNLAGTGFYGTPTVKLTRTGYNDIEATGVTVVSANKITCTLGLANKVPGTWNVNVINPDGQEGSLARGFTITNASAPAPTVISITPSSGQNTTSVSITSLLGTGFYGTPTVKLTRTGYSDITATGVTVVSSSNITCNFNLARKMSGSWNVNVMNPDEQDGILSSGFSITNITPPTPTPTPTATPERSGDTENGALVDTSSKTVAVAPATAAGQTVTFAFNQKATERHEAAPSQVQITMSKPSESFAVIAEPVTVSPSMQITSQPVAGYLEITPVGVSPDSISKGVITFTVDAAWLTKNNIAPENVVLQRYHDQQWGPLPTTYNGIVNGLPSFSSTTLGFSYFAITANQQNASSTVTTSPAVTKPGATTTMGTGITPGTFETTKIVSSAITIPTTTAPAPLQATDFGFPGGLLGIIVVIIVIIVIAAVLIRQWWIRRQNPMLFRRYD